MGVKNEQLVDFVAAALGNGGHIDVYVEHHRYDIHDWFAKDNDDLEDYDEDKCVLDDISSFVKEPQFIGEEEVIIPNRCTSDPFLNKLCKTDLKKTAKNTFGTNEGNANAFVEDEKEDQSVDPIYKVKPGIVCPDHDPDHSWKDMVPILGMKFKDHEDMKMMLANYGVVNGYQLWYKRNDYKSLLVLCGRNVKEGRCASRVGRKGIQENVSKASKGKEKVAEGKGKEKVAEGKGKEKVVKGSKVAVGNKKWTKQAIKLSKSPSKKGTKRKTSDNFCKFRLWGSWMQNEASFQIKTLIPYHNLETHTCTCRLWEVYPSGYQEFEIVDLTGIPCIHDVAAYAFLMKDPVEGVSDFYNKRAWQNCYSSFIKPLGGQSMWVKTGLPPSMPPKKRVMPGRPKGKRQKHPDESGFESAASALKRMRMDATASGSGLSKEENMEEPVHMEEPVQEADVQEPILRRGLRLRRPSHRILLNKWKKPFQFDEHGTGSTTEKAFDISDE
ncbi:calcium/proton exchanger [Tanacetum coccineum]